MPGGLEVPVGPALHHLALRVADPVRAAAFYTGLLGLPELRRERDPAGVRAVWLRAGEAVLMLERHLRGAGAKEGSGHVLVFATDDLGQALKRLTEAGVAVDDRTAHTLYFHDPDGHRVGLSVFRFAARD